MNPEEIITEFKRLLNNKNDYNKEQQIYNFFNEHLVEDNLDDFFDAIIANSDLAEYAEKPFLIPLWDKIIDDELVPIGKDIYAKKQTLVSSFHVAIGLHIYCKVDGKNLDSEASQYYLSLGKKYHSYHCKLLYLIYLDNKYELIKKNKVEAEKLLSEIFDVSRSLSYYLTPGYLLHAKTCWENSEINDLAVMEGLVALYNAKALENFSQNEIHNAYLGKPMSVSNMNDIDDMINAYIKTQPVSSEMIKNAQENIRNFYLSM